MGGPFMKARVESGLDVLVKEKMECLRGKRVALLGNPISVDKDLVHVVDRCLSFDINLVRLFGPEHGLYGDAQDMDHVKGHIDRRTNLECISLYGQNRESLFLNPDDLSGVDILVCDLQDVGSRYYTFSYTIAFAMMACAKMGVKCMVLDRPNPIGGHRIEGNRVKPGFQSFVGEYPLHNRHGYTLGELCSFFQEQHRSQNLECDLDVVWMNGWKRNMRFSDTGLPWVMPSPNMPTEDTALVYPGLCLLEGTNLSEGRGTTRPFELIGAPYIEDPERFAAAVSETAGPGVQFRPCYFRPTFQKHGGQLCGGLQIHVTDPVQFQPLRTGVAIIQAAYTLPGFDWRREVYEFVSDRLAIDLLFGDDSPRKALEKGATVDDVALLLDCEGDEDQDTWRQHWHEKYDVSPVIP